MSLFGSPATSAAEISEAARLAAASYATTGLAGVELHGQWRALEAVELGFAPGVQGLLVNGVYTFGNAAAQVYISADGKELAISFRGTDTPEDYGDYDAIAFQNYLDNFSYFLNKIAQFCQRDDIRISASDILVTGHSLGAGAANLLRDNDTIASGFFQTSNYITFASPLATDRDDILNIGFDNDRVYKISDIIEGDHLDTVDNLLFVHSWDSKFNLPVITENWNDAHSIENYIFAINTISKTAFVNELLRDDFIVVLSQAWASVSYVHILNGEPLDRAIAYVGNGENNVITAGLGNDRVDAGDGLDTINAGAGADAVWGGKGNDILRGQAGADTLRGGADQDSIYGGTENDALHGEDGNDWLQGQEHNDSLFGGIGVDTLFGEAGNDTLDGGAATDRLIGGIGDDLYIVDADVVVEHAGEGIDLVRTTNVSFGLSANVEHLVGVNALGQRLVGNSLDNWIAGSIGNDTLNGATGHDTLNGGMGADRLIGGLGNDRFVVDHAQDVVVEFADQGFDTVVSHRPSYTLGVYVEDLESGDATSRTLIGNGYGNRITGHAGADTLNGAGGNDVLSGRGGNDRMIGGPGDDYFYIEGTNDIVVEFAGQGIDTINTTSASYRLPNFVDDLDAGYFSGSTTMNINTNRSMIGNNLDNIISTNYGNDVIYGLDGNDTIYASNGRDLIIGGSGADVLYGGAGDDVFVYGSTMDAPIGPAFTMIETLRDFQNGWVFGNDRIDLSRIDARAGGTVNEAFVYIGSWWFSGQAGELRVSEEWRWHTDGIYRWVQIASGDVNGDAYADFEIAIQTSDLPDIDWFIL